MSILSTESKAPDKEGMIDGVRLPGGSRWKDSEHRRKGGYMEAKFVGSRVGKGGSSYSCCYFLYKEGDKKVIAKHKEVVG